MRKLIITAIILTLPSLAMAQTPTEMVKARQEQMKAFGKQVGVFAAMAKGQVDYTPEAAQAAADTLAAEVAKVNESLWAPGTSSADLPGVSEAKPALWENYEKVATLMGNLKTETANMQQQAGLGKPQMLKALGALGETCRACHSDYKLDD
ncbi:cytochrome c [Tropicimonas sp. IMCC34043]|uniref:c-type cytochrome n=1 Tax=Tropicimonas sp. IMCC34043 TaxID=2248760 RepID=UPI000E21F86A|nr:cytochrome c [Tropicimonas sp. IMCC34043]